MSGTSPQIGDRKVKYIEKLLCSFDVPKLSVLEWGSGGSTVYFTRFLRAEGIPFEWVSLEYDREWFEKIKSEIGDDPSISLRFFDVGERNPRRRDVTMDEYVSYPSTLGKKFDLIIVDGRKRRRCLVEARELLSADGIVLLDDAFRHYYWSAFELYPNRKFLWLSFWEGSLSKPSLIVRYFNALNAVFYKTLARMRQLKRHFFPVKNRNTYEKISD